MLLGDNKLEHHGQESDIVEQLREEGDTKRKVDEFSGPVGEKSMWRVRIRKRKTQRKKLPRPLRGDLTVLGEAAVEGDFQRMLRRKDSQSLWKRK